MLKSENYLYSNIEARYAVEHMIYTRIAPKKAIGQLQPAEIEHHVF